MKKWLLLLFLAYNVQAADIELTWTNATYNTDGTIISNTGPTSLENTIIYWGVCLPDDTPAEPLSQKIVPATAPGEEDTATIIITTPARWCIVGTHKNEAGEESDFSSAVFRDIVMVPTPPENLTVAVETVFTVVKQENRFILVPVGTISPGLGCFSEQYVNGYFAVPRDLVQWSGTVEPLVVVAECS
jgi:hypothetical protein